MVCYSLLVWRKIDTTTGAMVYTIGALLQQNSHNDILMRLGFEEDFVYLFPSSSQVHFQRKRSTRRRSKTSQPSLRQSSHKIPPIAAWKQTWVVYADVGTRLMAVSDLWDPIVQRNKCIACYLRAGIVQGWSDLL